MYFFNFKKFLRNSKQAKKLFRHFQTFSIWGIFLAKWQIMNVWGKSLRNYKIKFWKIIYFREIMKVWNYLVILIYFKRKVILFFSQQNFQNFQKNFVSKFHLRSMVYSKNFYDFFLAEKFSTQLIATRVSWKARPLNIHENH